MSRRRNADDPKDDDDDFVGESWADMSDDESNDGNVIAKNNIAKNSNIIPAQGKFYSHDSRESQNKRLSNTTRKEVVDNHKPRKYSDNNDNDVWGHDKFEELERYPDKRRENSNRNNVGSRTSVAVTSGVGKETYIVKKYDERKQAPLPLENPKSKISDSTPLSVAPVLKVVPSGSTAQKPVRNEDNGKRSFDPQPIASTESNLIVNHKDAHSTTHIENQAVMSKQDKDLIAKKQLNELKRLNDMNKPKELKREDSNNIKQEIVPKSSLNKGATSTSNDVNPKSDDYHDQVKVDKVTTLKKPTAANDIRVSEKESGKQKQSTSTSNNNNNNVTGHSREVLSDKRDTVAKVSDRYSRNTTYDSGRRTDVQDKPRDHYERKSADARKLDVDEGTNRKGSGDYFNEHDKRNHYSKSTNDARVSEKPNTFRETNVSNDARRSGESTDRKGSGDYFNEHDKRGYYSKKSTVNDVRTVVADERVSSDANRNEEDKWDHGNFNPKQQAPKLKSNETKSDNRDEKELEKKNRIVEKENKLKASAPEFLPAAAAPAVTASTTNNKESVPKKKLSSDTKPFVPVAASTVNVDVTSSTASVPTPTNTAPAAAPTPVAPATTLVPYYDPITMMITTTTVPLSNDTNYAYPQPYSQGYSNPYVNYGNAVNNNTSLTANNGNSTSSTSLSTQLSVIANKLSESLNNTSNTTRPVNDFFASSSSSSNGYEYGNNYSLNNSTNAYASAGKHMEMGLSGNSNAYQSNNGYNLPPYNNPMNYGNNNTGYGNTNTSPFYTGNNNNNNNNNMRNYSNNNNNNMYHSNSSGGGNGELHYRYQGNTLVVDGPTPPVSSSNMTNMNQYPLTNYNNTNMYPSNSNNNMNAHIPDMNNPIPNSNPGNRTAPAVYDYISPAYNTSMDGNRAGTSNGVGSGNSGNTYNNTNNTMHSYNNNAPKPPTYEYGNIYPNNNYTNPQGGYFPPNAPNNYGMNSTMQPLPTTQPLPTAPVPVSVFNANQFLPPGTAEQYQRYNENAQLSTKQ